MLNGIPNTKICCGNCPKTFLNAVKGETSTPLELDDLLGTSRVISGQDWVYLLYGPECYMDSENKLANVRGLVFQQICRINREGKLVVHF